MKHKRIYVIRALLVCLVCLIAILGCLLLQPDIVSYATRKGFDKSDKDISYPRHPAFAEKMHTIQSIEDVSYPSKYERNTIDIYYPNDIAEPKPLIIWIHGGAFVGGDKRDCSDYLKMLASEGYIVVNMNYALAPEVRYPTPLYQVEEVSKYLKAQEIVDFDEQQIFIGGDSAGAQIAGQFTLAQMDKAYGEQVGITSLWEPDTMKGFLSFCGLLVLPKYDETNSWILNIIFHQSAWSYFDSFQWKTSPQGEEANFIASLTSFPPTFITDGAAASFLQQAQQFAYQLKELEIPCTEIYYDESLRHEYQFDMSLPASLVTYEAVVQFLDDSCE